MVLSSRVWSSHVCSKQLYLLQPVWKKRRSLVGREAMEDSARRSSAWVMERFCGKCCG